MKKVTISYVRLVKITCSVLYQDHFCNYGVKKPCSSRVYGYTTEGMYSIASVSPNTYTSKFCAGECKEGKNTENK